MNQKVTMKEIPSADRPYEKSEKLGAGALSDTELLAVLLRTGTRGENALSQRRKRNSRSSSVQC